MSRRLLFKVGIVFALTSTTSAIKITEDSGTDLEPCSDKDLAPVSAKILTESNDCTTKAAFNWRGRYLPTAAERNDLCTCTALIAKLQTVKVPYCGFYLLTPDTAVYTGGFYSYKDLVEYAFGACSTSSTRSTTTTTTTVTPSKTPSSYDTLPTSTPLTFSPITTSSPSFDIDASDFSSSKKSKTGVVIGVVVALVVVAAIAVVVIRKRKHKKGIRTSLSVGRIEGNGVDAEVPIAGGLSPLGGDDAYYTSMVPSPLTSDTQGTGMA